MMDITQIKISNPPLVNLWHDCVTCIKNTDLSQEFSTYHIKWTVGVIMDEVREEMKESADFRIPPITDELSALEDKSLRCKLGLWIPHDHEGVFGRTYIQLYIRNFDIPIPVIYRFGLSHKNKDLFLTNPQLGVPLHSGDDFELLIDINDESLLKRDGHLVVHCWLDIPTAIIKKISQRSRGDCMEIPTLPWNISNFLKKSKELYKSVIGENREFKSHSDVTLVLSKKSANSDGRFHCHKDILAGASSMFNTMFSLNQWKEGEDGTVDIDDIDEDTMKAVLYHIYTGKFKDTKWNNIPNLIYAADKYQLKDLKSWAEIQIMAWECKDIEWIDCLIFAQRHQLQQLQAICIRMLSSNVRILASDEIKKLSKESQEEIMKMVEKRQVDTTQMTIKDS